MGRPSLGGDHRDANDHSTARARRRADRRPRGLLELGGAIAAAAVRRGTRLRPRRVRRRRPPGATVALADSALGKILVDARARPCTCSSRTTGGTPTCYDECATNWPALVVTGYADRSATALTAALTTVARTDGGDAGQVRRVPALLLRRGRGRRRHQRPGGRRQVWFVVGADGEPIKGSRLARAFDGGRRAPGRARRLVCPARAAACRSYAPAAFALARSLRICPAASLPGAPMTQPPGCVPEPHW